MPVSRGGYRHDLEDEPLVVEQQRQRIGTGLTAGLGLAVIGLLVGGGTAAASLNRLWLLVIPTMVLIVDLLVFGMLYFRFRRGRLTLSGMQWWAVSQFDLFALSFLFMSWAVLGGGVLAAILLGALAAASVLAASRWRSQVLTAFLRPGSSRLSWLLALLPLLGTGGGAGAVITGRAVAPHRGAAASLVTAVAVYLLLFAQSSTVKISQPEWTPTPPGRHEGRRKHQTKRH